MFMHFYSWQPTHVKMATVSSLFLRALRICDPPYLPTEIDYLKNAFKQLAYPAKFVMSALSKARRTFFNPRIARDKSPKKYIVLPHANNLDIIRPILKSHDTTIVNKKKLH